MRTANMTHLFAGIEKHPGAPGAAFRQAILALRAKEDTSSLAVWAPLVFVGTTNRACGSQSSGARSAL